MAQNQNQKTTTMVLVGKTGNGKSSTGNSILGYKALKAARSFSSTTQKCEMISSVGKDGRVLNVVDTPGLFDPIASEEDVTKEIKNCIHLAKDGLHAVLFVLSLNNRFTDEESSVLDCLQIIFGPDVMKYMVVVFTGADMLEYEDLTFEQILKTSPPQLQDLLRRCNNRVVLFNNRTNSAQQKGTQVNELLNIVDSIVAANGGQPYSNELFEKYQKLARSLHGQEKHPSSQSGHTVKETANLPREIDEMVEIRVQKALAVLQEQLALEQARHQNTLNHVKELQVTVANLTTRAPAPAPPPPPPPPPAPAPARRPPSAPAPPRGGGKCFIL